MLVVSETQCIPHTPRYSAFLKLLLGAPRIKVPRSYRFLRKKLAKYTIGIPVEGRCPNVGSATSIISYLVLVYPGGLNSFNFMQFLGKYGQIVCWCPPGELHPLLGEILVPPLHTSYFVPMLLCKSVFYV